MPKPTLVPTWGTETGSEVLGSLVPTSATFIETKIVSGVTYGLIDYAFSGTPDLSSVAFGQRLTVSGFTLNANNGDNFFIESANAAEYKIRIRTTARTSNSLDESGVTGSATVSTDGTHKQAPSTLKRAMGWISGEKMGAGWLNWWKNQVGSWLAYIDEALPEGYDLLQAKLTAGDNVTIEDNGDGTERISANLVISTVEAIGKTYTQSSHGFSVGNAVRHNGTNWAKGQANTVAGATAIYFVSAVSGDDFTAIKEGRVTVTGHGLGAAGTLLYLSASSAGALTSTKPVGSTSAPLGFFLPVAFVEDANTIHVIGNGYPTFDNLLAEYVNTGGSDVNSVTFSNLTVGAWGGSIRFVASMANQTNGGDLPLYSQINGSSSSNYNHTQRYDNGTNWTRNGATGQTLWTLAYVPSIGSSDQPLTLRGELQLGAASGSTRARVHGTYECEASNRIVGEFWGDYTSVSDITSFSIGDLSGGGHFRFRANANHFCRLYRDGKF